MHEPQFSIHTANCVYSHCEYCYATGLLSYHCLWQNCPTGLVEYFWLFISNRTNLLWL